MDGASIADTPQCCHLALRSDGRLLITRMWARRIGNSAVQLMQGRRSVAKTGGVQMRTPARYA